MDEPQFEVGHSYTRRELRKQLGGDLLSNFPVHQGRVVYCCVRHYTHPDAPEVILVSREGPMVQMARKLVAQQEAVPVFLKQMWKKESSLVYQGKFRVERCSDDPEEVTYFAKRAHRLDVIGVLFLRRVVP
jgi:hypothetical protein